MNDLLADFVDEALESLVGLQAAFARLAARPAVPARLGDAFRRLHGLKGACGFLGLPRCEALAHAAESLVSALDGRPAPGPYSIALLGHALERMHGLVHAVADGGLEPAGDDTELAGSLQRLAAEIASATPACLAVGQPAEIELIALDHEPAALAEVWQGLTSFTTGLGARLGKPARLTVRGGGVAVSRTAVPALRTALIALIRNACDHGIETAPERAAAHKPAVAVLKLTARGVGTEVHICLADDGRGVALGLDDMVFAPGFSTAPGLSLVSGRGMGLSLVRTELARLGGRVDLSSTPGRGAVFTLVAPGLAADPARLRPAA